MLCIVKCALLMESTVYIVGCIVNGKYSTLLMESTEGRALLNRC